MPRLIRPVALLLGLALVGRGLVPGWRETPGDFVNYWLPARVMIEGGDVAALLDDRVFAAELVARGLPPVGRASQFPPPALVVGLPLALPDLHDAAHLFLILKLALLFPIAALGARVARVRPRAALLVALASGAALGNDFRFGQIYLLLVAVLFGVTPGLLRASWGAGVIVAGLASIKLFPAVWLPIAGRRAAGRRGLLFGLVAAVAVGWVAVGPEALLGWAGTVLGPHLDGQLGPQGAWAWSFQSLNVLLRRCFLLDPVENPDPVFPFALGYSLGRLFAFGLAAAWIWRAWTWASSHPEEDAIRLRAGLLGVTGLALAPATATYHLLLLLAPLAWVWPVGERRAKLALLGVIIAVGWIPYGVFFRAGAVFAPLGFPRLALLWAAAVAVGLTAAPSGPSRMPVAHSPRSD